MALTSIRRQTPHHRCCIDVLQTLKHVPSSCTINCKYQFLFILSFLWIPVKKNPEAKMVLRYQIGSFLAVF